jgi:hypothetical protein
MSDNDFQKQWMDGLKKDIKEQLYNDYVKTDILTEGKFDIQVSEWIDEI